MKKDLDLWYFLRDDYKDIELPTKNHCLLIYSIYGLIADVAIVIHKEKDFEGYIENTRFFWNSEGEAFYNYGNKCFLAFADIDVEEALSFLANKDVVNTKTYTIQVTEKAAGTSRLTRTNDGFNAVELLGLCNMASLDLVKQLEGNIKVDTIE